MNRVLVWKVIRINTWDELITKIESIKSNKMAYRGQSNSKYNLESSLKREVVLFESQKRHEETTE